MCIRDSICVGRAMVLLIVTVSLITSISKLNDTYCSCGVGNAARAREQNSTRVRTKLPDFANSSYVDKLLGWGEVKPVKG